MPPEQPSRHHLERAQEHGGLPVALGAEAVAIGHQPLHGDARKLAQAPEVLEGVSECAKSTIEQDRAQAHLDLRRLHERLPARAVGPQFWHEVVLVLVALQELLDGRLARVLHRV